jgi:colanic acid biosynthesis protein WcaH
LTKEAKHAPLLPGRQFLHIVANSPLVSIDLVMLHGGRVLLGRRLNRPAQGYWFVPGGRIRKDECLADAYQRITTSELGFALRYDQAKFCGIYEHFYNDSIFGDKPSTHYIAMCMVAELAEPTEGFPTEQHDFFAWWPVQQSLESPDVHPYTKQYLLSLTKLSE